MTDISLLPLCDQLRPAPTGKEDYEEPRSVLEQAALRDDDLSFWAQRAVLTSLMDRRERASQTLNERVSRGGSSSSLPFTVEFLAKTAPLVKHCEYPLMDNEAFGKLRDPDSVQALLCQMYEKDTAMNYWGRRGIAAVLDYLDAHDLPEVMLMGMMMGYLSEPSYRRQIRPIMKQLHAYMADYANQRYPAK